MNTKFSWRKKNVPTVYIYFNFDHYHYWLIQKKTEYSHLQINFYLTKKKVVALGIFKYAKKNFMLAINVQTFTDPSYPIFYSWACVCVCECVFMPKKHIKKQ